MKSLAIALAASLFALPAVAADVLLNQQGRLLDASDAPVNAANVSMTFSLYHSEAPLSGEEALWEDSFPVNVVNGLYAVDLGGAGHATLPSSVFGSGDAVYLEVSVEGVGLLPRLPVGTVARAAVAQDLACAGCVTPDELSFPVQAPLQPGDIGTDLIADGAVTDAKIAGVATTKLTGTIDDAQLSTVSASRITGTLTSDQVASLDAAKVTGQLQDAQLAGIAATKVIGTLSSDQIASLDAAKVTGTLASDQIASLDAAKVTGQLTSDQIASLDSTKLTGSIDPARLPPLTSSKPLSGDGSIANPLTVSVGTGADQVAAGNHTHPDLVSLSPSVPQVGSPQIDGDLSVSGHVAAHDVVLGGGVVSGMRVQNAAAAPTTCDVAHAGQIYFDTTSTSFLGCNGKSWMGLGLACTGASNLASMSLPHYGTGNCTPYYSDLRHLSAPEATTTGDFGFHDSCGAEILPAFAAIDFGTPRTVTGVRIQLHQNPMKGAYIQASNNSTNGADGDWTTIVGPIDMPSNMDLQWWTFPGYVNSTPYRWYRLYSSTTPAMAIYRWELDGC